MARTPQSLIAEVGDLFSLPDIFFQVKKMLEDPHFTMADIGMVIAKDPALSARLLRVVNSAGYGFQSRIDTISRAVSLIGGEDLYDMVLATCVVNRFDQIPTDLVDMTDFWMRSVHCAVANKLLAQYCGVANCERFFLIGLLHDIGSLVIYQILPEQAAKVLAAVRQDRRLLAQYEQQILGFTHGEVGCELLKSWGLPETLYRAVACYQKTNCAGSGKQETLLLHLAGLLVADREYGRSVEETLLAVSDEALTFLGVDRERVEQAMRQADMEFPLVFEQFMPLHNIRYGSPAPH